MNDAPLSGLSQAWVGTMHIHDTLQSRRPILEVVQGHSQIVYVAAEGCLGSQVAKVLPHFGDFGAQVASEAGDFGVQSLRRLAISALRSLWV